MIGFDATEEEQLYTELMRHSLQLAVFAFAFVPVLVPMFMFVFVSLRLYQFPAKLVTGVCILIFFKF